ncbi:MAG: glycosyltransferase [Fusobacteriaceae bacterium]
MKKIIIHTGSLKIGGQEKMLSELLKIINLKKYKILLLIEEDCGIKNIYEKDIPSSVEYKFLTTEKFMQNLEKYKNNKNIYSKIIYSILLKFKKKISIKNFKNYINHSDVIIDYNLGLLRYINKIDLKGKKLVGWSHAGLGGKLKDKKKEKNRKYYSDIVTINEEMKKCYSDRLVQYGIKIHKIHNFLDQKVIIAKSAEKIEENLEKYIISVGALTENKNHSTLIKAFKNLVDIGIEEDLIILGEGKERKRLETLINKLNLNNRVKLLGNKNNPYKYINQSLFFVQTSYAEGFPLVLLESMILGKAVISTENYGSKEILENGKHGIIVKNNVNEISQVMYSLIKDSSKIEELSKKSKKRSEEFCIEAGKNKIEEFLSEL